MFPRRVILPPLPPWHNWRALVPVPGSPKSGLWLGHAVGVVALAATAAVPAAPHPPPTVAFQDPLASLLVISTACPGGTDKPATVKGDPEVTMTVLLLFSESSTWIWVASAVALKDDNVVPP